MSRAPHGSCGLVALAIHFVGDLTCFSTATGNCSGETRNCNFPKLTAQPLKVPSVALPKCSFDFTVKIITPFWASWLCPFWSSAKCSFNTWTSSVLCFSAVSKLCLGLMPSSSILTCRNSSWQAASLYVMLYAFHYFEEVPINSCFVHVSSLVFALSENSTTYGSSKISPFVSEQWVFNSVHSP